MGVGIEYLPKIRKIVRNLNLRILPANVETFVKKTFVLPTKDSATGFGVNFIFSNSLYEKQAIKRAKSIEIGNTVVKFTSLGDLIIQKIITTRAQDFEDVKNIILKNPDFDKKYVTGWLEEFDRALGTDYTASFKSIVKKLK